MTYRQTGFVSFAGFFIALVSFQAPAEEPFSIDYRSPIVGTRVHSFCRMVKETPAVSCESGWSEVKQADGPIVRFQSESESYSVGGAFFFGLARADVEKMSGLWPLQPSKKHEFATASVSYRVEVLGREQITTPAGTFATVKVKISTRYKHSGDVRESLAWWDPVSGLTIRSEESGRPENATIRIVGKITRTSSAPRMGKESKASTICTVSNSSDVCMNAGVFASLAAPKQGNESAHTGTIDLFRREAISYRYSGSDFDKLLLQALSRNGYQADPASPAGAYVETKWRKTVGKTTLLRTWLERSKMSALITKDLFNAGVFWVLVGCAIEESPNDVDWAEVRAGDNVKEKVGNVIESLNAVIREAGGAALGKAK